MTSRFERILITHLLLLLGCCGMELWSFFMYDDFLYGAILDQPSFIYKTILGLTYFYMGGGWFLFMISSLFGWVANAVEPSTSNLIDGDE